jgi:3-dehydroquinate dehydratase
MPKPNFVLNGASHNLPGAHERALPGAETLDDTRRRTRTWARSPSPEANVHPIDSEGLPVDCTRAARARAAKG